jgi:diguanylate cyclase (GGDEF)-like protein
MSEERRVMTGWRRSRSADQVALPHRTMVRALGVLFSVGGSFAALWTALPHGAEHGDLIVVGMGALAVVFGGALLAGAADRLHSGWVHAFLAVIQVVITVAYVANGEPGNDVRFFFIWAAPYAALYFHTRVAAVHMLWTALLLLVALAVMPGTDERAPAVFLMTMGTVLAAGVLVAWASWRLRAAEAVQRHRALHDELTGLPNRQLLALRVEECLARTGAVVVLFLDVDQFKVVNDGMGHDAGDALLIQIAQRLRAILRAGETLARFGGDEFVIVCADVTPSEAEHIGERIAAVMEAPFQLGDRETFVSVSTGIAVAGPQERADTVLRNADAAMYRAKARGRARAVMFDDAMHHHASTRLDLESGLRRALDRGELRLYYQPILDIATEQPVGFEALVRWQHPERGLVSPADFIPVAEETGLIVPIGEWVCTEALAQVQRWRTEVAGADHLSIAVNLSARQLLAPDLAGVVSRAIAAAAIPAAAVHLEVTESVVMNDVERSIETLLSLRLSGVAVAIDDFGTGYSSLNYLKQLPVTTLKIDRSFVDGLGGNDPHDPSIVDAIISLGRALGLDVVAEGVETPEQLAELRRLGAGLAQGYLWAAPMPAEQVPAWLGARLAEPGVVRARPQ